MGCVFWLGRYKAPEAKGSIPTVSAAKPVARRLPDLEAFTPLPFMLLLLNDEP